MPISDLLKQSTQQLTPSSDSPRLDAEILLAHCLQKPRSFLYTWPEHEPDTAQHARFNALIAQRLTGQPIAYLTGYREFWGLSLKVTADTLIPRPDTELLVETALQHCPSDKALNILDLGTGSGAIAIALATELPKANITATDQSAAALAIASENARTHQQANINFLLSDWFNALPPAPLFDLIVSNPPYIVAQDAHLSRGDVRFEPQSALVAGPDGLDDLRQIISLAPGYLQTDGMLMLEHGYDQATAVSALLHEQRYQKIHCLQDLAGNDRVSYGHAHPAI